MVNRNTGLSHLDGMNGGRHLASNQNSLVLLVYIMISNLRLEVEDGSVSSDPQPPRKRWGGRKETGSRITKMFYFKIKYIRVKFSCIYQEAK